MRFLRAYFGSTDKRGVIAMTDNLTASQTNLTDHGIALLRVTSGGLLLTHGLIKVLVFTPAGTAGFFESIGFPGVLAYPVMAGEIVLGAVSYTHLTLPTNREV